MRMGKFFPPIEEYTPAVLLKARNSKFLLFLFFYQVASSLSRGLSFCTNKKKQKKKQKIIQIHKKTKKSKIYSKKKK